MCFAVAADQGNAFRLTPPRRRSVFKSGSFRSIENMTVDEQLELACWQATEPSLRGMDPGDYSVYMSQFDIYRKCKGLCPGASPSQDHAQNLPESQHEPTHMTKYDDYAKYMQGSARYEIYRPGDGSTILLSPVVAPKENDGAIVRRRMRISSGGKVLVVREWNKPTPHEAIRSMQRTLRVTSGGKVLVMKRWKKMLPA